MSSKKSISPESIVRDIKRKTRRKFTSEEKIIVGTSDPPGHFVLFCKLQKGGLRLAKRRNIQENKQVNGTGVHTFSIPELAPNFFQPSKEGFFYVGVYRAFVVLFCASSVPFETLSMYY